MNYRNWFWQSPHPMMSWPMIILGIILLIVIILIVVKLLQPSTGTRTEYRNNSEALDILKKRYANGELSDEEYQQKKKILEG